MYIFNQDNRPYFIITKDELLFRKNASDPDMQRHSFSSIESITLGHRHEGVKGLILWLDVKIKEMPEPLNLQISTLDLPPEEVLSIMRSSLTEKLRRSLPSEKEIKSLQNRRNRKSLIGLALMMLIVGLAAFHERFPPLVEDLNKGHLKTLYKADDLLCSAKIKAAYPTAAKDQIMIKDYCGLFGFWYEESQKSIPSKHLETEFSHLQYSDYIALAKQQIKNRSFLHATDLLNKAIYLDPNDEQAYLILALVHHLDGNSALAIKNNQHALRLNPNSSAAHSAMGLVYSQKHNYKKSQEHYARSVQLHATAEGYTSLAHVDLELGETAQAIMHYEHALQYDNDNTEVLNRLGLLYWEERAYKKAAEVFEKVYSLLPKDPRHFLNYYEISMIEPTSLSVQDKEGFCKMFAQEKSVLIIYDMLNILELAIKQQEILPALKQWDQSYSGQKLNWSFAQMLLWLETSALSEDERQKVKRTIGFFIAYQQTFNLKHQAVPTGERL